MKKVWLVQRGSFRNIQDTLITGLDSLINYDYMGAAEWGALPKSLYRILNNFQKYSYWTIDLKDSKGSNMVVFCKEEDVDDITINALYLTEGSLNLKEYCDLPEYISGLGKNNFWWDLENDFMIMFGKNQDKLNIAFENMIQKDYFDKIKNNVTKW